MSEKKDWTKEELEKEYVGKYEAVTIPVNIRLEGKQKILILTEAEKILSEAKLIALGDCTCRKSLKKCTAPLGVCISLDQEADILIKKALAHEIHLKRALDILKRSHEAGLVYVTYTFKGNEKPAYICSCCSCCCHSMSALVRFGLPEAVVKSGYLAVNNFETCINCGTCVQRCQFKARHLENDKLIYDERKCFGCGLCVSTCPTKSIRLEKRN